MKKKDIAKELLLKLSRVFSADLYFVNNRYAFPGPIASASESVVADCLCIFNPDITEALREMFPENPVLYTGSIRKVKEFGLFEIIEDEKLISSIHGLIDRFLQKFDNAHGWETIHLTEEELNLMFGENRTITLFKDNPKIPEVVVSKALFPLMTKTTMNHLTYSCYPLLKKDHVHELLFNYDFEYFNLKMKYLILNMDE